MVQWGVMFGDVISQIGSSRRPIVTELMMIILSEEPVKAHVYGVGMFWGDDIFVAPAGVELSVFRADLGWGQPILMKVLWSGTICSEVMNRAASSKFAAEDMRNMMILGRVSSGPLLDVMGMSSERKIYSPARLCVLLSLSMNAPE